MTDEQAAAQQPVLTERRGNVLLITLNRPEVRNAVNAALAAGVAGALEELDGDDGLSVGVLTGAGGFFCAGMDLGAFVKGESRLVRRPRLRRDRPALRAQAADRGDRGLRRCAGGMEIALACDLIVAARGAKMGIPEAKRSLVAAGGALLRLPRRMPYHVVMELALTGDPLPAERFHELGLVNRLAEPGGRVDVALELAARSPRTGRSRWSPPSRSCRSSSTGRSAEMWEKQGAIAGPVFASEDAKEGAAAFKEKREPVWKGR